MLNRNSRLERGAAEYRAYLEKKNSVKFAKTASVDEARAYKKTMKELKDNIVDLNNYLQTLDKKNENDRREIEATKKNIAELSAKMKKAADDYKALVKKHKAEYAHGDAQKTDSAELAALPSPV